MIIGAALLVGATIVILGACLLLILAVVAVRARRHSRTQRDEMLLSPLRRPLITVASGEDDDGAAAEQLTWATGVSRAVLDRNIVELLTKIRGVPAEQLVHVLEVHGAVDAAVAEMSSRSAVKRARAAQLLGPGPCRTHGPAPRRCSAATRRSRCATAPPTRSGSSATLRPPAPVLAAIGAPDRGLPAATAAEALQSMGVGISDVLRDGMADPNARTRMVAAHLSGERSFTRGLPELRGLLDADPDLTVRETSAIGHRPPRPT